MINLACPLPKNDFYLACSGGIDSMVALDFLLNGKHRPKLMHLNHGTTHGQEAEVFVRHKANELGLEIEVFNLRLHNDMALSKEEFWRTERYRFFHSTNKPVITAHHLDDAVEWWIFSSLHGNPRLTPITNKNVIRPFLFTTRADIKRWQENHKVEYIEDPSNNSPDYMRNVIRHDIIKHALVINPGLHKTVRKLYAK